MSIHIGAKQGDIAEAILLPGDPLRAKYIAETFLEGVACYTEVRGMYGFTGTYEGKRVSVQGTGMGQPSASIYINELISSYNVKTLLRVGSCGSLKADVEIRDLVIAMAASTDSNMNARRFVNHTYAPTASPKLLFAAYEYAKGKSFATHFGNILSTDTFYNDDMEAWKQWAAFGVKAVEMEVAQLYTLAAKHGVEALGILTVSDSLVTQKETTSEEREKTFNDMIHMALHIAVQG